MSAKPMPLHLMSGPSKEALLKEFRGKPLEELRTPAFVVDRALFAKNCARMHESAQAWVLNSEHI